MLAKEEDNKRQEIQEDVGIQGDLFYSNPATRFIVILSEITMPIAFSFTLSYMAMCQKNNDPIYLMLNSIGGQLSAMSHIVNIIGAYDVPLITIASGNVSSSAYYIFLHGKRRYSFPYTQFLSHTLQFSGWIDDNLRSLKSNYDAYINVWESKLQNIERRVFKKNKYPEFCEKYRSKDLFFDVETAHKYGVVTDTITKIGEVFK